MNEERLAHIVFATKMSSNEIHEQTGRAMTAWLKDNTTKIEYFSKLYNKWEEVSDLPAWQIQGYPYRIKPDEPKTRTLAQFMCWDDHWAARHIYVFGLKDGKAELMNVNSSMRSFTNYKLIPGTEFEEEIV